jgi:hypothetical protein
VTANFAAETCRLRLRARQLRGGLFELGLETAFHVRARGAQIIGELADLGTIGAHIRLRLRQLRGERRRISGNFEA